jgi:hypothetical protein
VKILIISWISSIVALMLGVVLLKKRGDMWQDAAIKLAQMCDDKASTVTAQQQNKAGCDGHRR